MTSEPLISAPPIPRHPRLQRFYLFLGVSVFASVVYFSSVKPHTTPDSLAQLYDQDDDEVTKPSRSPRPPNLVLVLTDDQDSVLLGASRMPQTRQLLGAKGAVLSNAFVSSPLCCPSRASILTGRYVHNHGTRNNSLEGHCSDGHWQDGPEKQSLAAHLNSAGYDTFFAGKYLNQYGKAEAGGVYHVPPGWNSWFGLKGNSRYYNYTLSANGAAERHGNEPNEDYLTKVIWRRAKEFLDTVTSGDGDNDNDEESSQLTRPFFMMLSTPAAHAPFTPESKYSKNFADLKAPRTKNFNIKNDNTKHWLLRLGAQPLSDDVINKVDGVFRDRLRTLLTVDDMVADIIERLEEKDLLDNTYIVFTSDNGYHLGQFSMPIDKREPYEFDIRVPLMVRGPGITEGTVIPYATVNVDLAPTLLDLAGVVVPDYMDGVSLKPLLLGNSDSVEESEPREHRSQNDYVVHVDQGASPLNYSSNTAIENGTYSQNFSGILSETKPSSSPRSTTVGSYHSTDIFARRSILVEHSGEGYSEQTSGCQGLGSGLYGCSPDYDCKCADSTNNTYACVRQLFIESTAASTLNAEYSRSSDDDDDEKEGRKGDQQRNHYDVEQGHPRIPQKNEGIDVSELSNEVVVPKELQSDGLVTFEDNDQYVGLEVRPIKDIIFCEWDDNDKFVEYYDLSDDSNQLHNSAGELSSETLAEYKTLLASLKKCQGQSCRAL